MHSAKFHLYVEQKLKTGPALAGLTGPTPTALLYNFLLCLCLSAFLSHTLDHYQQHNKT